MDINISIPFAKPKQFEDESRYLNEALESGWTSGGDFVQLFEEDLGILLHQPTRTVTNGTTALQLAYITLGLLPGDEIIVPSYGFQAATNVAILMGLKPVFVDVNPDSWMLDVRGLSEKVTKNTKAIVVIHNYGFTAPVDAITEFAWYRKIPIIEDTAEAFLSKHNGKYSGTFGDFGTYSFHATKSLTTGEGGAVTFRLESDCRYALAVRSHGLETRGEYNHLIPGSNFRLSNLLCALGHGQILNFTDIVREKNRIRDQYYKNLSDESGVILHPQSSNPEKVIWSFPVKLNQAVFRTPSEVSVFMRDAGIEIRKGFVPACDLPYIKTDPQPVARDLYNSMVVLPAFLDITNEEIDRVCEVLLQQRK